MERSNRRSTLSRRGSLSRAWQAARRDYGLTGADSRRAVELGLADAQWYRPPIDPHRLQALTTRSNGRAARDVVLWLAVLAGAGLLAWWSLGSWWAIPAFLVYGDAVRVVVGLALARVRARDGVPLPLGQRCGLLPRVVHAAA